MKRLALAVLVAASLSGCSASSALSGLVGSKPEITAQAGAENVKQTVGVTAKNDESSKQENTINQETPYILHIMHSKKGTLPDALNVHG